jgi:hypothetical protein
VHLLEAHFVVESGEVGALIIRYTMTANAMKNKTISHHGSSQNNILYIGQTNINNLGSTL